MSAKQTPTQTQTSEWVVALYTFASLLIPSTRKARTSEPRSCLSCSVPRASLCSVFETPPSSSSLPHTHPTTHVISLDMPLKVAQWFQLCSSPLFLPLGCSHFLSHPLGPLSVTYIRSFHFQRDNRAFKWTANDRQSGTSPLAVSPPRECGRRLNQSCCLPCKAKTRNTASQSIRIHFYLFFS